jgi:hypothetical protein
MMMVVVGEEMNILGVAESKFRLCGIYHLCETYAR